MATRFRFIAGIVALGACTRGGSGTPAASGSSNPSPDVQHFLTLSCLLTGYATLDSATAAAYLQRFRASADQSGALDELLARSGIDATNPPESLTDLTKRGVFDDPESLSLTSQILAAWFSGTVAVPNGTVTQTWEGALAWQACTFTKPPGTCGGLTGYWSKAPA